MNYAQIAKDDTASIRTEDGLLIVDFTRKSYENEYENLSLQEVDGVLTVHGELIRREWYRHVPISEGHPSMAEYITDFTWKTGPFWNRVTHTKQVYGINPVRLLNFPRTFRSNHFVVIY
jgi:hypothetical protein